MIFHNLKAIFMHVERTGGVSVREHLLNFEKSFERIGNTKHYSIKEAKRIIKPKYWDTYFKFGIVRNPYDRLVSWYSVCQQRPEWAGNPMVDHARSKNTFDEFIKDLHPNMKLPQWEKVYACDYIGRYEDFNGSLKFICDTLKIKFEPRHENGSKHKPYRQYYNSETKKIVQDLFKMDLEVFGYEF